MAGLDAGQGLESGPGMQPLDARGADISSRRHFATIAWLRWRIFVNTLRGKSAKGELVAKILSYPLLAIIVLVPSAGAGFSSWYFVQEGEVRLLAIPLWIIFALWQFIGMNTSATGPAFDLATLIRFPLRYRDYFLIRLSFGLMDPPTLAGIACLLAMCVGVAIADARLALWVIPVLALYATCNVFFSRMIYTWLERWLTQRRTREMLTGFFLALSIAIQFLAQYAQRLGHAGHGAAQSPWLMQTAHIVLAANWWLPPGLAAASIDHAHSGLLGIAGGAFCALLAYTLVFVLVLHARLHAQFHGENLSEAPAYDKAKSTAVRAPVTTSQPAGLSLRFLPAVVAACLVKELRYLVRSGPRLYVLIMPVIVVFLFSVRSSSMEYSGFGRHSVKGMLFAYGCAYAQLIFASLIYNSLGADGAGVQFYFMGPMRIRDVMLAKNLLTFGIFALEAACIYAASAVIAGPAPADLTAATLAWSAFALLLNTSIGNIRSILAPKMLDPSKVRSQNVSGLNSLISLTSVAIAVGLGVVVVLVCGFFRVSYWPGAAFFLVLAGVSLLVYLAGLARIDEIAQKNIESLTRELAKA